MGSVHELTPLSRCSDVIRLVPKSDNAYVQRARTKSSRDQQRRSTDDQTVRTRAMSNYRLLRRALRSLFLSTNRKAAPRPRFRPSVCQLEDRCLLTGAAASITLPPTDGAVNTLVVGSASDLWFSQSLTG